MDLQAIFDYLEKSNAKPAINYFTSDDDFLNGEYNPKNNTVSIKENRPAVEVLNTTAHEHTHALLAQLQKEARENDNSQEQLRFKDGIRKLMPNPFPSTSRFEKGYRNNPTESFSFGVGNSFYPYKNTYNATNNHQDSTRATEMAVLLDLASRARDKRQQTFIQTLSDLFR